MVNLTGKYDFQDMDRLLVLVFYFCSGVNQEFGVTLMSSPKK